MEQTNSSRRSIILILGLTLVVVIVPLASTALFGSVLMGRNDSVTVQGLAKDQALRNRDKMRAQRRAYERALDYCRDERIRTGEEVACPDFNDTSTYQEFIDDPLHGAAPSALEDEDADLDARDRALLEQYVSQGTCPARLAARGLYTRCLERLEEAEAVPLSGLLNDHAFIEMNAAMELARTLRERLEQIQAPRQYDPSTLTGSTRRR